GPATYARHDGIHMPALPPVRSVPLLSHNPVLLARDTEHQSKVPADVRTSSPLLPGDAPQAARTEKGHAIEGEEGNLTGSENGKAKTPGDGEHNENGNGQEGEASWTR